MTPPINDNPASDLPAGLAAPARRALNAVGLIRLEQFTGYTEDEVQGLHGMGPKAVGLIRSALTARGLAFALRQQATNSVKQSDW